MKSKQLSKDFYWVGYQDHDLRVFDIIMETEFGTSYNSYVLKGSEKTAVFEASKAKCIDEYLKCLEEVTELSKIDYLVVDHTEPDHTGAIERMLELNPSIKIVGSTAAINFLKEITNKDISATIVKTGDEISLGDKTLRFISAPNLHWPDSMFTYIPEENILVTCDMFGAHYASDAITNDNVENQADYEKALRYYYDMIMGPFKKDVLSAIDKIQNLDIKLIATGHGPVLVEEPWKIVNTYKEWSSVSNPNKKKTVIIPYVSAYGYTKMLADKISEGIQGAGDIDVRAYDLVTAEQQVVLDELTWADGILFGTPTIVGEALKPIWDITTSLFARTHGGKIASAFGSYGWSGEGVPHIMQRLSQLQFKIYGAGLKIRFKPSVAQLQDAFEFGYGFGMSVLAGEIVEPDEKDETVWKCLVCGELVKGKTPPQACPVCGVGPEQFVKATESETMFRADKSETYIIVGNGVAGTTAAEEIRKRNSIANIEIISEESLPGYNRPMLTKGILSELDSINLFIKPEPWYDENKITLTLNKKVTGIDADGKTIEIDGGETRKYDKLILATGAESNIPPVKGAELDGVFAIRGMKDIEKIQKFMKAVKTVIVVGGGILGLEAAWEVSKAGKDVTVLERSPALMTRQLDQRAGALLKELAGKAGVTVLTGASTEEIEGEQGKVTSVKLADGTVINADMVIFSAGVKQNTTLAEAANLEIGRAIIVNEKMETSVKDIYSCGDNTEHLGINYAIWPEAMEMARVAGANAAGDELTYTPIIPVNSFSGFNTALFAVGDNGKDENKVYKTLEIYDAAKGFLEKLYFVNNRFCGGILLGDVSKSAKLLEGLSKQATMEEMLAGK